MVMNMVLRKCRVCGLEAHTEEDLCLFKKHKDRKNGVAAICKNCTNDRSKIIRDTPEGNLRSRYMSMMSRCYYENNDSYNNYGERGILVCEEWDHNPDEFIKWGLENGFKKNLQIDRIDNSLGYSPINCRWITQTENQRNTRSNVTDFINMTRICFICKQEKPISEFITDRGKPLGKHYYCKLCHREKYVLGRM